MTDTIEREIKLPYSDPDTARRDVLAAGASPLRPRRLQRDYLLDRETETLQDRHCTLRVRVDGDRGFLTFKGPPEPGPMKVREELETTVGDGALLIELCARLGFHVWFRYQKFREEYQRGALVITIDESPIGTFVELEGAENDILRMAADLDRSPSEFVRDSYLALFRKHQAVHGLSASDMLFGAV